jgi:hypothetical protein
MELQVPKRLGRNVGCDSLGALATGCLMGAVPEYVLPASTSIATGH